MVTVSQPQAHHLAGEQKARANSSSRRGGLSYSGFQQEGNKDSFSLEMSFRLWNYRGTEGGVQGSTDNRGQSPSAIGLHGEAEVTLI